MATNRTYADCPDHGAQEVHELAPIYTAESLAMQAKRLDWIAPRLHANVDADAIMRRARAERRPVVWFALCPACVSFVAGRSIAHKARMQQTECDSRCRNARRPDCDCKCVGKYHGHGRIGA